MCVCLMQPFAWAQNTFRVGAKGLTRPRKMRDLKTAEAGKKQVRSRINSLPASDFSADYKQVTSRIKCFFDAGIMCPKRSDHRGIIMSFAIYAYPYMTQNVILSILSKQTFQNNESKAEE